MPSKGKIQPPAPNELAAAVNAAAAEIGSTPVNYANAETAWQLALALSAKLKAMNKLRLAAILPHYAPTSIEMTQGVQSSLEFASHVDAIATVGGDEFSAALAEGDALSIEYAYSYFNRGNPSVTIDSNGTGKLILIPEVSSVDTITESDAKLSLRRGKGKAMIPVTLVLKPHPKVLKLAQALTTAGPGPEFIVGTATEKEITLKAITYREPGRDSIFVVLQITGVPPKSKNAHASIELANYQRYPETRYFSLDGMYAWQLYVDAKSTSIEISPYVWVDQTKVVLKLPAISLPELQPAAAS